MSNTRFKATAPSKPSRRSLERRVEARIQEALESVSNATYNELDTTAISSEAIVVLGSSRELNQGPRVTVRQQIDYTSVGDLL